MKKIYKIFFIVVIIFLLITLISVIIGKINDSKGDEIREEQRSVNIKENYSEYKQLDRELVKYRNNAGTMYVIAIGTGAITGIVGLVWGMLALKDKKGDKVFYNVLLGLGIAIVAIGFIAGIVVGIVDFIEDGIVVALISSAIGSWFILGYVTYKILPNNKYGFLWGFFLGIIGIIVAAILKSKTNTATNSNSNNSINNDSNKYDDLARLQKLKEAGAITDMEFEEEKKKILER